MNVLIAADYAAPNSGSFVSSLIELGRALRSRGDSAVFVFPKSKNTLRDTQSNWCRWFKRESFPIALISLEETEESQLQELLRLVRVHGVDVLHLHFGIFHRLMLKHRRKFKGIKVIMHDHMDFSAGYQENLRSKIRNRLNAILYNCLDIGYVAIASQKYNYYRKKIRKCWYLPNALAYDRNVEQTMSREACRKAMGISSEKVCLFLGWSLDIKGLDIAIKAVHECRKTSPDLVLAVVGFGEAPSAGAARYIEEKTGIPADSPWIKYWPSTEDIYAYHRAADVYLSASRTESFSFGLLEAISQNTPVAVSDIVGTKWSWNYSKCFHYPTEDHRVCAASLDKALKAGRIESNYTDITAEYDIFKWCGQMIDIYKE